MSSSIPYADGPFWSVQGDYQGNWTDVYHFREQMEARSVLKHIVDLDVLPRELDIYDDFRVAQPKEPQASRKGRSSTAAAKTASKPANGRSAVPQRAEPEPRRAKVRRRSLKR